LVKAVVEPEAVLQIALLVILEVPAVLHLVAVAVDLVQVVLVFLVELVEQVDAEK
jgi:hypothetical protein